MDKYILRDENSVFFECGFSCDNVIFARFGSDGFFVTDPRYTIEAREKVKNAIVIEAQNLTKAVRNLLRVHKIKKIFFDPKEFDFATYAELVKNTQTKFVAKKDISKKMRIIKSADEIAKLKIATDLGRDVFDSLAEFLNHSQNLSEIDIFAKTKEFMTDSFRRDVSFEPITAVNENSAKPHALPDNKLLSLGDLLLVDAGLKFERYCSDRTFTFSSDFGFDSNNRIQKFKNTKMQKVYDVTLKAQQEAISRARVGMKACEIDKIARDIIAENGFAKYFVHSTGHGVGLDIHELPVISARSETIIEESMVFTVEPGIYLPDEFGVRIEDMVVMKNGRAEVL